MSPILGNMIAIAFVVALVVLCIHTLRTSGGCAECSSAGSCGCSGGDCCSGKTKITWADRKAARQFRRDLREKSRARSEVPECCREKNQNR